MVMDRRIKPVSFRKKTKKNNSNDDSQFLSAAALLRASLKDPNSVVDEALRQEFSSKVSPKVEEAINKVYAAYNNLRQNLYEVLSNDFVSALKAQEDSIESKLSEFKSKFEAFIPTADQIITDEIKDEIVKRSSDKSLESIPGLIKEKFDFYIERGIPASFIKNLEESIDVSKLAIETYDDTELRNKIEEINRRVPRTSRFTGGNVQLKVAADNASSTPVSQITFTGVDLSGSGSEKTIDFSGFSQFESGHSYVANRIPYTNADGTALTDSANLTFDGTDLKVGGVNALTATTGQYKTFVTVGSANADYLTSDYADGGAAIKAAIEAVDAAGGGIVQLLAETYTTGDISALTGSSGLYEMSNIDNVTIRGAGRSTVIDASGKQIALPAGKSVFKFINPENLVIENLYIVGDQSDATGENQLNKTPSFLFVDGGNEIKIKDIWALDGLEPIYIEDTNNYTIQNIDIRNNEHGILLTRADYGTVSNVKHYRYARNASTGYVQTGIKVSDSHNVNFDNLQIRDFEREFVQLNGGSSKLTFNNTIADNTNEGLSTEGGFKFNDATNVVISNHYGYGVGEDFNFGSTSTEVNNIYISNFEVVNTNRGIKFDNLGGTGSNIYINNGYIELENTLSYTPVGILIQSNDYSDIYINNITAVGVTGHGNGIGMQINASVDGFHFDKCRFWGDDGDIDISGFIFSGSFTNCQFLSNDIRDVVFTDTTQWTFKHFFGNYYGNSSAPTYYDSVLTNSVTLGDGNTTNHYLNFKTNNNTNTGLRYLLQDGSERGYVRWNENEDLEIKGDKIDFSTAGKTKALTINETNGFLGVNKTSPQNMLHVDYDSGTTDNKIVFFEGGFSTGDNSEILVGANKSQGQTSILGYLFNNNTTTNYGYLKLYDGTTALTWLNNGNVGIGTSSPTELLDINGDTIRLRTSKTPASATDTGNQGEIAWDANYIYVCTATNTWVRAALSTW